VLAYNGPCQGIFSQGGATLFNDLDGVHEFDLICLIRVPSLLQCVENGLGFMYFLTCILLVLNVETNQLYHSQQFNTIELFLNHLIFTVYLDLSMH
jgi:hypothetical protein